MFTSINNLGGFCPGAKWVCSNFLLCNYLVFFPDCIGMQPLLLTIDKLESFVASCTTIDFTAIWLFGASLATTIIFGLTWVFGVWASYNSFFTITWCGIKIMAKAHSPTCNILLSPSTSQLQYVLFKFGKLQDFTRGQVGFNAFFNCNCVQSKTYFVQLAKYPLC